MNDAEITCPNCGHHFPLTDTLAGPAIGKLKSEYEARLAKKQQETDAALAAQKAEIEAAVAEKARAAAAAEIETLRAAMQEQADKLAEARKVQAAALKRERELEEREREVEIDLQRRLNAALKEADAKRAAAAEEVLRQKQADIEEAAARKAAEKDQHIDTLNRQIETLKRKAEQGSQQRQGEAAEATLESRLAAAFPGDRLDPVGKGVRGADCRQVVIGPAGEAGAILWEVKQTRNWAKDWLPKLREDQRDAGAELAVLVSEARPDGIDTFDLVDGVWIAAPRYAVPLAAVLRRSLLDLAVARGQRQGQATKTELLYDYLTGPQFRARVEAVVERFDQLRADLDRERKTMQGLWARREKALGLATEAMVGMYGDVHGIAGSSVAEIPGLAPGLLGPDDTEDSVEAD